MRHIYVEDGLRLRFPGRDEDFNEGIEVGLALAKMAAGCREFTLRFASTTLDQARTLASHMGYRIHVVNEDGPWAEVVFLTGSRQPKLKLVYNSNIVSCAV